MSFSMSVLMNLQFFHHDISFERDDEHIMLIISKKKCAFTSNELFCCTRNFFHNWKNSQIHDEKKKFWMQKSHKDYDIKSHRKKTI